MNKLRHVAVPRLLAVSLFALALAPGAKAERRAADPVPPEQVHFIHMGGNDCPPCVVWRATEYPRLQQSPVFRKIRYSYVTKTVRSPVPAEMFLPAEVKPLKAKLDLASGGRSGSPHQAIVVDGEVYDYWFGPRSAQEIEEQIRAIVDGTKYPRKRCVQRTGRHDRSCEVAP